MVALQQIKDLRAKTGAGMMDCKNALIASSGDFDNAIIHLRKQGLGYSNKRAGKVASEGSVGYYIHAGGKIGVLLEVNCETDFSSKTETFQTFVKDVSMHIAAADPSWISRNDVPAAVIDQETNIISAQIQNKPPQIMQKIIDGRLNKFYKEQCLLDQLFVRDQNCTITDLVGDLVSKIGEKVEIKRFTRYVLGE